MAPASHDEIHERVLKLEWQCEETQRQYQRLHNDQADMQNNLREIAKTIFQVKWTLIGAVAIIVMQTIGVIEFIKRIVL